MPLDLRTRKLAQLAVNYSVSVKPQEKVIISGNIESIDFLVELYKAVILAKAHPIIRFNLPNTDDFFYKYATKEQIENFPKEFMDVLKQADKYIGINTKINTKELSSANPEKITARQKIIHPISTYICNEKDKIRRCTIAFPCQALAQEAEMSLTDYENFVYESCLQDWKKLKEQYNKIKKIFENA